MRSFCKGYAMNCMHFTIVDLLGINDVASQCPLLSHDKLKINVADSNNSTFKRTAIANKCNYQQCSNIPSLGQL
jgi:hypothetical protein